MKKKIMAVLTVVMSSLIAMTSLFGCFNTKLSKVYAKETEDVPVYGALTVVSELEGYSKVTSYEQQQGENLVLLSKYDSSLGVNVYKVFNLKTGTVVFTASNDANVSNTVYVNTIWVGDEEVDYIVNRKTVNGENTSFVTELYNVGGTLVGSATSSTSSYGVIEAADLLGLDGKFYRVSEDGSMALAFEEALAQIPASDFDFVNDKYYYFEKTNDYDVATIYVYDKLTATPVSSYAIPTYVGDAYDWFVLENGKILLQYQVPVDAYSSEYDFARINYGTTQKYNLVTKIINPKNGKDSNVKTNVVIDWIYSGEELKYMGYNPDLKNVAFGSEINEEQKLIDTDVKTYTVGGRGSLSEIKDFIPGIEGANYYNGYWVAYNDLGQGFLYNEKEKLIGEISNSIVATKKYIVTDSAIYDYELNKVYDFKANNYTVIGSLLEDVLLESADGLVYAFSNGNLSALTSATTFFVSGAFYSEDLMNPYYGICDGVNYTYYNANKVSIGTFTSSITLVATDMYYNQILVKSGTSFYYAQDTVSSQAQ